MKKLIRLETVVPLLLSVYLLNFLPMNFSWWVWILIFLLPDSSMIGYLLSDKIGAFSYNLFHHQLVAVMVAALGLMLSSSYLELAGLVMLGHSSLDRMMGYGLKLEQGFSFTHLGRIGKPEDAPNGNENDNGLADLY